MSYTINSLSDVVAMDGDITLREALEAANTNAPVCDAPAGSATETDIVTFAPGLAGTITLGGTELAITDDVEIRGPGADFLTIHAAGQSRVFSIAGSDTEAKISSLQITGGSATSGGGIYNSGLLTVADSTLSGNSASSPFSSEGRGGGIYSDGTLTVLDSMFLGNSAISGGAIDNRGTASVFNSMLCGNSASGTHADGGGAIRNYGTLTLTNSILSGNSAHATYGYGGAIYSRIFSSGTLSVSNCTISGNSAATGGGICCYSKSGWTPDHVILTNSIVALNSAASEPDILAFLGQESGLNLIGVDPGFVDFKDPSEIGPGGDGAWGTPDDVLADLHLTDRSPAIDLGSNSLLPSDSQDLDGDDDASEPLPLDADGNSRLIYGTVDIGAYEYSLPGDLNGDRFVGSDDLDLLRAHWGQHVTPHHLLSGDVSGDGRVGADDLDIVRAHWGQATLSGREAPSTVVTLLTDTLDAYDRAISLREALLYAEQPGVGATITFASSLDGGQIVLGGQPLYAEQGVSVDASSLGTISVHGDGKSRVLSVLSSAEIGLIGLDITGGSAEDGGAICNFYGPLTLRDSTVSGNSAASSGGGIFNFGTLALVHCNVSDNTAGSGGGIYSAGTLTVDDSTFSGNCATGLISGDDVPGGGGGIYAYYATTTVSNSIFSGNSANDTAGFGGAIANYESTLSVVASTFSGNSSSRAAVGNLCGTATVIGCTFVGNHGSELGGALYNFYSDSTLTVIGSVFSGNSATRYGGGAIAGGGALTVINSTISGNSSTDAHGMGGGIWSSGSMFLCNSIVALNSAASDPDIYGTMTPESGFNLVGVDPLFVRNPDPGSDDYGDLHLTDASPAINTGSNALLPADSQDLDADGDTSEPLPIDLDGNSRVEYETVDIGAYEYASLYMVNSLDDIVALDDLLTLREALQAANTNTAVCDAHAGSAIRTDIITFAPGLAGTITLGGTQLEITDDVDIQGPSRDLLTIDAAGHSRVFSVTVCEATIARLSIVGGRSEGLAICGGGIYTSGTLNLSDLTIADNWAFFSGGGIFNEGVLTLTNSTVSGNSASQRGGGIYSHSTLTVLNSDILDNAAPRGGGICSEEATLTISRSNVCGNTSYVVDDPLSNPYGGEGGGVYLLQGTAAIVDSVLSGNSADRAGGGIYNLSTLAMTHCNVSDNTADGSDTDPWSGGGAIYSDYGSLVVDNSTFLRNSTGSWDGGGGIYAYYATTSVSNSIFSGNSAYDTYACGGAIFNYGGTLSVTNSTFCDNSSSRAAVANLHGAVTVIASAFLGNHGSELGGALYSFYSGVTLTVISSVFSGNSATRYGGGAIACGGHLIVINSTIAGNSSTGAEGMGGGIFSGGTLTLTNSIVALNTATSHPNIFGTLTPESGFNLIGIDPLFVRNPDPASGDYGDPRLTDASPAINTGSNDLLPPDSQDLDADGDTSEPLPIDLDGNPRVIYETVDIGAYEYWLVGDLNTDRFVGADDLDVIRANWGQAVAPGDWLHGDASGDGFVGADDLDLVRARWGQSVTPPPPALALELVASNHESKRQNRRARQAAFAQAEWFYELSRARAGHDSHAAGNRSHRAIDAVLATLWA